MTLIIFLTADAFALEIKDIRWGFDQKIVRQRFNPLSVLVDNPTAEAFDGELRLVRSMGGGARVDAPLAETIYVGPFGQRWVQFYPYLGGDYETWRLEVRNKRGRVIGGGDVPQASAGWPARIMLESAQAPSRGGLPIRRLPENLFPPFVTATDPLQAVLIDFVPEWDEPRRQSFLDWLHRGGVVYVLHTANDSFPSYPASLGALNGPLDVQTVGSGRVIRVPRTRTAMSPSVLTDLFTALPKRIVVDLQGKVEEASPVDVDDEQAERQINRYADAGDPLNSGSFLSRLKSMTRPEHNWALLHLMFWVYIFMVFPGCYLLGRRFSDYRLVYGALLATVLVFSLLFAIVGRRGYGETTAVNMVGFARPLPDGQLDVSLWSNAFVTSGGDYTIRHNGTGALYSTCNFTEAVNGIIRNGAEAAFDVDIPPFSSREFAHRIKAVGPSPKLTVLESKVAGETLQTLRLAVDETLPKQRDSMLVLFGDKVYGLTDFVEAGKPTELRLSSQLGAVAGYVRIEQYRNQYTNYGGWQQQQHRTPQEEYRDMFQPLLARSLGIAREGDAQAYRVPPGIVRVVMATPVPQELVVQNQYLGRQDGWLMYLIDLPVEPTNEPQ